MRVCRRASTGMHAALFRHVPGPARIQSLFEVPHRCCQVSVDDSRTGKSHSGTSSLANSLAPPGPPQRYRPVRRSPGSHPVRRAEFVHNSTPSSGPYWTDMQPRKAAEQVEQPTGNRMEASGQSVPVLGQAMSDYFSKLQDPAYLHPRPAPFNGTHARSVTQHSTPQHASIASYPLASHKIVQQSPTLALAATAGADETFDQTSDRTPPPDWRTPLANGRNDTGALKPASVNP